MSKLTQNLISRLSAKSPGFDERETKDESENKWRKNRALHIDRDIKNSNNSMFMLHVLRFFSKNKIDRWIGTKKCLCIFSFFSLASYFLSFFFIRAPDLCGSSTSFEQLLCCCRVFFSLSQRILLSIAQYISFLPSFVLFFFWSKTVSMSLCWSYE